jgi:hypothetical protein
MSLTNESIEYCPVCNNAIVVDNSQKYCIMCGYKIPPYTETLNIPSDSVFTTNMLPKKQYKTEPHVASNGIYIPETEYAYEGCEPNYRFIRKEVFIEAYIRWIAPLLKDEREE